MKKFNKKETDKIQILDKDAFLIQLPHLITREYFQRRMFPHMITKIAKTQHITAKNKAAWRGLSSTIHKQLDRDFDTLPVKDLIEMMNYQGAKATRKRARQIANKIMSDTGAKKFVFDITKYRKETEPQKSNEQEKEDMTSRKMAVLTQDYQNFQEHMNIMGVHDFSATKRNWLEEARRDQLEMISYNEVKLAEMLASNNIPYIRKAPIVASAHTYFAQFYLPNRFIILEVKNEKKLTDEQTAKLKSRDDNLKRAGFTLHHVNSKILSSKVSLNIFLHQIHLV